MKPLIFHILPYVRISWWRKLARQSSWHGANVTMITMFALFCLFIQVSGCLISTFALHKGKTEMGVLTLNLALTWALAGWLITPVMVNSAFAKGRGLEPSRLGQLPLSIRQLFLTGVLGNLVQPVYWILIASSLLILGPLSQTAVPILGIISGLMYMVFCALLSWTVGLFGQAILSSRFGRELLMLGISLLAMPMVLLSFADLEFADKQVTAELFDRQILISNMDVTEGLLSHLKVVSPATLVMEAANGKPLWLLPLAMGTLGAFALALWSLRRILLFPPSALRGRGGGLKALRSARFAPTLLGTAVSKEIRYLSRTMDHILGLVVAVIAFFWAMFKPDQAPAVLFLASCLVVVDASAMPLNAFGLDASSADRYRLLPLSGRQVMLSKNLAYFFIMGTHVLPMILAGFVRVGPAYGLGLAFATAAMILLVTTWGNIISIKSPAPRAFFNFDSKEQVGGIGSLLGAIAIWGLPAAIWGGLGLLGNWAPVPGQVILFIAAVGLYRHRLAGDGRRFSNGAETMRARLNVE